MPLRPQALRSLTSLFVLVAVTTCLPVVTNGQDVTGRTISLRPQPDRSQPESELGDDEMIELPPRRGVPEVVDGRYLLPPLEPLSTRTDNVGEDGRVPEGYQDQQAVAVIPLPEDAQGRFLDWDWAVSNWAAANTFSYPLYFQDRMLERHGHQRYVCAQPLVSGFRFFATVPSLPYLMAVSPPCECEYTMGYFRAGSCVYPYLQRPPCDRRGVIAESAAVAGAVLAFP